MATSSTPPQLTTEEIVIPSTPAVTPPRVVGEGYLTCDFCECKLTKLGEVYQVSEKARNFRDDKEKHAKAIAQKDERISELERQLSDKDAEIAALRGNEVSRRQNFL